MHRRISTHLPRPNPAPEPERNLVDHIPLVRFLARRMHRRMPDNIDIDDLFSAGMVGLMEASTKFKPDMKVRFASYANFRIRGAILDSLRILDWAPRELRRKGREVHEAVHRLTSRLGRAPSEEQVASEMHTSLCVYQKLLADLDSLEVGPLHRKRNDDSGDEEPVPVAARIEDGPLNQCLRGEVGMRLEEAIEALPERERLVTTLYYYQEMSRHEIGLALGLDEVKVSQIRTAAVMHLRKSLSDLSPNRGLKLLPARPQIATIPHKGECRCARPQLQAPAPRL